MKVGERGGGEHAEGKETKDAERAHGAEGESREEAGKEAPAFAKVQAER